MEVEEPAGRASARFARVAVDEQTWRAFRIAIGERPVSQVLAQHVEREVAAARAKQLEDGRRVSDQELLAALASARQVQRLVAAVVDRIEWRLTKPREDA